MVKLLTKLINETDKELAIYEHSSNGAQTWVALLGPKHVPTTTPTTTDVDAKHDPITTPTTNYVSENSRSTQELPNSHVYSVDPNDTYAAIRIWYDEKSVLSVSSDEAIDNSTITIVKFKDGVFEKQLEPRNPQNQPAPTSEDAASTSEDDASTSSTWGNFINFFRPRKSANTNAGK